MESVSIKKLKQIASIKDVISNYIKVVKSGGIYKALCPFHNEKTPSLVLNVKEGYYHCFGCNAHGDVFQFIMGYKNISFKEAVIEVADYYNVSLNQDSYKKYKKDKSINDKLINSNLNMLDKYKEMLKDNECALSYLKKRNISNDTVKLFELGYANDDSKFKDRVIFPIHNENGELCGFGGRILDDSKNAKYVNSSNSTVFSKKDILYNLNRAKDGIRDKNAVLITEGYFDVITLVQNGITNVVASLGTSITYQQIGKLRNYTDKMILMFDGDTAGLKAMDKLLDMIVSYNMQFYVVIIPDSLDPSDYANKFGIDKLKLLIENAVDFIDYKLIYMLKKFDISNASGKDNYINRVFDFMLKVDNQIFKDIAITKLSKVVNVNERLLHSLLKKRIKTNKKVSTKQSKSKLHIDMLYQKNIILTLLLNKELCKFIIRLPDVFGNEFYKRIFDLMKESIANNNELDINYISYNLDENDKVNFNKLLNYEDRDAFCIEPEKIIKENLVQIQLLSLSNKILENNKKIKQMEFVGNKILLYDYVEEGQLLRDNYNKIKFGR